MILSFIKCALTSHEYTMAGSCPYTDKTYKVCVKCGKMISV